MPTLQGEAPEGTIWGAQAQLSMPADQVFGPRGEADLLSLPDSRESATGGIRATATGCRGSRGLRLGIWFPDVAVSGCRHKSMLSWVLLVEREDWGRKSARWVVTENFPSSVMGASATTTWHLPKQRMGVRWEVREGWVCVAATSAPLGF